MQIMSRAAKFSCFKPAEEMVYIGLDDASRTKGKAAVDVVGAQTGKSGGSVLQQVSCSTLSTACGQPLHDKQVVLQGHGNSTGAVVSLRSTLLCGCASTYDRSCKGLRPRVPHDLGDHLHLNTL